MITNILCKIIFQNCNEICISQFLIYRKYWKISVWRSPEEVLWLWWDSQGEVIQSVSWRVIFLVILFYIHIWDRFSSKNFLAGKSTVAALLERFYDIDDGKITIDGVSLKELDPTWLRGKAIGFINQVQKYKIISIDTCIYSMTINIRKVQSEWQTL